MASVLYCLKFQRVKWSRFFLQILHYLFRIFRKWLFNHGWCQTLSPSEAMEKLMAETAAKSPAWPDCYLNASNRDISEYGRVSPNWQHVVSSDWYPHRYRLQSADGCVLVCVCMCVYAKCVCVCVSVHAGIRVCIIMDPPVQSEKHFTLRQPSAETDLHHSSEYNYHAGENGAEKWHSGILKRKVRQREREGVGGLWIPSALEILNWHYFSLQNRHQ